MSFPVLANVTVQAEVKYGQTEARTMLDMINSFRTGSDAWYWNSDDTEKIYAEGLQPLEYDKELENAAMQRAAEIALHFAHTRPNNTSCFTSVSETSFTGWASGENIAAGYGTAQSVFVGWQETNDYYSGQGHRRNMLSSSSNKVGIGHVIMNGVHYWVQEFGYTNGAVSDPGNAVDSTAIVPITVNENLISSFTLESIDPNPLLLNYGETGALPAAICSLCMSEAWPGYSSQVTIRPEWGSMNTSCVTISGAAAAGLAVGSTSLTAALMGQEYMVPVTVTYDGQLDPDYTLPASLTTLKAEAFQGTDAAAVLIPNSLHEIGSKAFSSCSSLNQVTFMSDDIMIAEDAFEDCSDQLIFFCRQGSTAENYAAAHGINVVRIL